MTTVISFPAAPDRRHARRRVRAFVSYAHDSEQHKRDVLRLCRLLRRRGIDVRVDQWSGARRRDWYVWAIENIIRSDFVLVVASPICRRAGDGRLRASVHPGVQTELALLRDRQHGDRRRWERKILPVILPGSTVRDIPVFLLPNIADHYRVTAFTAAGAADLLAALHTGGEQR